MSWEKKEFEVVREAGSQLIDIGRQVIEEYKVCEWLRKMERGYGVTSKRVVRSMHAQAPFPPSPFWGSFT